MNNFRKGISLIELVLTIALVSIVIQVVYSVYFVGNTSYSISTNKGFSQQDVRIAGDFISSELKYITDVSSTNMYVDEYYSLKIDNVDGKKVLTKTFHEYTGDGSEADKEALTNKTVIRKINGNWNVFTITNTIQGEIDIVISQEEGLGNQKSGYELPLKMYTVNNNSLLSNINALDLSTGGVLYYMNNSKNLLTRGIDIINTTPGPGETGTYSIRFFTSEDLTNPYKTITGNSGKEESMPSNPTREGLYFNGWNTKVDGTGTYYNGTKITIPSSNLDLHAIWSTTSPSESILSNLNVTSVKDQNGSVTISNGVYTVKKDKDVTINLEYYYNKPSSNLELVQTGFTGSINGSENKATVTVLGPNKGVTKDISITIREVTNHNKSVSIIIKLKGDS